LVTDVFPALALGVGEGSPALMRDPPRDPKDSILTRHHWRTIFAMGGVMALSVLAALAAAVHLLELPGRQATSVAFLTLAMAQLWHVFSMRNPGSSWIRNEITRNPWIWSALGLCVALLLSAVYWPGLAEVLSIVDPGASGWTVAVLLSLVPLVVGQLSLVPRFQRHLVPDRP
jgi:Ca2+-transporting ATPase